MDVSRTTLSTITHFRKQFLEEINIQFIFDKCHRYGWADTYVFSYDNIDVGYGAVWGKDKREARDTIFEFYLIQGYRHLADQFFNAFCKASRSIYIECQSNDRFLYPMFEKFGRNVYSEAILFEDHHETALHVPAMYLSLREQPNPDDRSYLLLHNGEEVGSGGFMLNYNFPYADIYYDIRESHRRKGFGSFFVQELKKEIYRMGRVPAARCNVSNSSSKATLLKAGMVVCGFRVTGDIGLIQ